MPECIKCGADAGANSVVCAACDDRPISPLQELNTDKNTNTERLQRAKQKEPVFEGLRRMSKEDRRILFWGLGITLSVIIGLAKSINSVSSVSDGFENAHRACYAYIHGTDGVEIDYEKALEFCHEGSLNGYLSSTTLLAELYYNGQGTPADLNTALHTYEMAAARGHNHARMMVFLIYFRDLAETSSCEDKQRSLKYLRAAANSGYDKAVELLSMFDETFPDAEETLSCTA